jgi:hypothetical protein
LSFRRRSLPKHPGFPRQGPLLLELNHFYLLLENIQL